MAIYSGFSHEKLWFSIAMLVHQRVTDLLVDLARWIQVRMNFAWANHSEWMFGSLPQHLWTTQDATNTPPPWLILDTLGNKISWLVCIHPISICGFPEMQDPQVTLGFNTKMAIQALDYLVIHTPMISLSIFYTPDERCKSCSFFSHPRPRHHRVVRDGPRLWRLQQGQGNRPRSLSHTGAQDGAHQA